MLRIQKEQKVYIKVGTDEGSLLTQCPHSQKNNA